MEQKKFEQVFKNKTILVTGHTGFIGSWLTLWLNQLGANVVGYSLNPSTKPSFFNILNLKDDTQNVISDLRNKEKLFRTIKEYEPEIVFHLAAQPLVRESYKNPLETFEINVLGTANILDAIRDSKVKTCIMMTSDKCYDNKKTHSHIEEDPMGGIDPYSASKGAAELIISSYRDSFFGNNLKKQTANIASIRAGNVIGGGDWSKDRIVPDIMKAVLNNEKLIIRNPNAIRPWQYVLEPIGGMLWLAANMSEEKEKYNHGWNFGPDNNVKSSTVKEIANKILEKMNSNTKIEVSSNSTDMYESGILSLNSQKSKNQLNWQNNYSIEETVLETIEWYKNYQENNKNMKEFSICQINKYFMKIKEKNLILERKEE